MSFCLHIRNQRLKLKSFEYVNYIWDELQGKNTETNTITSNSVSEYNNHLPVLLDDFWELTVEKLQQSKAELSELDQDCRIYLIVLLYQCTTHTSSQEIASFASLLRASRVYLILLSTVLHEEFFKSRLYKSIISNLQNALESGGSAEEFNGCMTALGDFVKTEKLLLSDLEVTLAFLVQVVCIKSSKIYNEIGGESPNECSVDYQSLLYLKIILQNENLSHRKFVVTTYLFNGLRKLNSSPHLATVQSNFRVLIQSLHQKFREDHYKTFLNAFMHIWQHEDFCYYEEAINIMNGLKEKYYRELIDCLNKSLQSKTPHKNVFRLTLTIICNPPKFCRLDKVEITNEIFLKNILINCKSDRGDVCVHALEALGEILSSPHMEKVYVKNPVQVLFNYLPGENILNPPTILNGLRHLISKKWHSKSRLKHIFVVTVSIIYWCERDYPLEYYEVLELLTDEATPFDLKPYLDLLSGTFLKMSQRGFKSTSFHILRVLMRMALHPMASSAEFAKHLYMAMVCSGVYKGRQIDSEIFINPIISEAFNFKELFRKCYALGLIRTEKVVDLMNHIDSLNESQLKFLGAIVSLTDYKDVSPITDYVNSNSNTIPNNPNLKYILHIYDVLLDKGSVIAYEENVSSFHRMFQFLREHLLQQSLRWDCVANAFGLMKKLASYGNLEEEFRLMKQEFDLKLDLSLKRRDSFLPVFYYSQFITISRMVPSGANIEYVKRFLQNCSNESQITCPDDNSKIWIGGLQLFTYICLIQNEWLEDGFSVLNEALRSFSVPVKLAALNLTFDLCNLVSHNFEDLITYMFSQLIEEDVAFKKTCLVKVDRLIRDDYLKLDVREFVIFISILGDRNYALAGFLKQLLTESFFVSNTSVITKYFVHLIIYINIYKQHPIYKLGAHEVIVMENIEKNILQRHKIYDILLNVLSVKAKFNILSNIATNILAKLIKNELKVGHGFWEMLKDSIYIVRNISFNVRGETEFTYKKIITKISQHILHKSDYAESVLYMEHQSEIIRCTQILVKLLFFNDMENIQKYIQIPVFDAIIHWTDLLFPELVYLVHNERFEELKNQYSKVENFYKTHSQNLILKEGSLES